MKLDTGKYDVHPITTPPVRRGPGLDPVIHSGYCPVNSKMKILGRYRHYEVAIARSGGAIVMSYADALKRGCTPNRKPKLASV
jgi:hypothetical protein